MSENTESISNVSGTDTGKFTIDYLLGKLDEISSSQSLALGAVAELGKLKSGGPGDVGMMEQAKAIADVVRARETTNQRLLALYERMYDDLAVKQSSVKEIAFRALEKASDNEDQCRVLSEVLDIIRHLG